MVVQRKHNSVHFSFSLLEEKFLERALTMLLQNYQINPAELDERAAAVWYSPAGCRSAGMSGEETAEWIKQLHALRASRTAVLESVLSQLRSVSEPPFQADVALDQADALMTALNDHRLLVAAHHNVGESEMNMRSFAAMARLPPRQQTALCEIEFLAYIIDELVHLLSEAQQEHE
jgi:hypothetical protein